MGMTDKEKAAADAKLAALQKKGPTAKPAPPAPVDYSKRPPADNMATFGKKFVNNVARTTGVKQPFEDEALQDTRKMKKR